jgi:signal peptidase I
MGKVRGYIPYVGIVTIILNDYPWLKNVMLLLMGICVIVARDPQS